MDANSQSLQTAVLQVLEDIPKSIHFELAGFTVSPDGLTQVRVAILGNRISVKYNPNLGSGLCLYNPLEDCLEAGFTSATGVPQKAGLVHESVHALMDMSTIVSLTFSKRWKVLDSEAAAYIAQLIYVRIKHSQNNRLTSPDADADKIFEAAWNIAMTKKPQFENLDSVAAPLRTAISNHPLYKKKANKLTFDNGVPILNGLPTLWPSPCMLCK